MNLKKPISSIELAFNMLKTKKSTRIQKHS